MCDNDRAEKLYTACWLAAETDAEDKQSAFF